MRLILKLAIFAVYFLIISIVLQAQEAFILYWQSQFGDQQSNKSVSKFAQILLISVFVLLGNLTLLVTPFVKVTLRKLLLLSCLLIITKYIFDVFAYLQILMQIFQLAALILTIIGKSIFYLASIKTLQVIIKNNDGQSKVGKCLSVFGCCYALSIVMGYALAYPLYTQLPVWVFLLILTSLTLFGFALIFISVKFQPAPPRNVLIEERPVQPAENNQNNNQAAEILRDNLNLGNVTKRIIRVGKQTALLIPSLLSIGVLLQFSVILVEYLVWTVPLSSQVGKVQFIMHANVMFGFGGFVFSILIGIFSDFFSIKVTGMVTTFLQILSAATIFLAVYSQTNIVTLLVYFLFGMGLFGLFSWTLIVNCKLYGGIFQGFAINFQWIMQGTLFYIINEILFSDKIQTATRFYIQLGFILILMAVNIVAIRKLPSDRVIVEFQQASNQSRQEQSSGAGKANEVEMIQTEQPSKVVNVDPLL